MRVKAFVSAFLLTLLGVSVTPATAAPDARASGATALLRVDQGGYLARQAKFGVLMARSARPHAVVYVVDVHGHRVAAARLHRRASWSRSYPAEYGVSFGQVTRPGRYRLVLAG